MNKTNTGTDFTDTERQEIIERALNRHGIYRCSWNTTVAFRQQFRRVADALQLTVHTAVGNGHRGRQRSLLPPTQRLNSEDTAMDNDFLSEAKRKLLEDAQNAGYRVQHHDYYATVTKGRKSVTVWSRGLSTRNDVDLAVAKGMTMREVRQYLELPA